ncbi:MAG: hypothetical protein Q7W05_01145 [Deltaproteobacteria bacterium]|nr:hypothetical protein [Deltaproteobacteria bacterium]
MPAKNISAAANNLNITITVEQVVKALNGLNAKQRSAFIEDLLAATNSEYLASIKEARADYRHGRVKSHREALALNSVR